MPCIAPLRMTDIAQDDTDLYDITARARRVLQRVASLIAEQNVCVTHLFLFFVVFLFGVDRPNVGFVLFARENIFNRLERGAHRVVEVIVSVLTVSADTV